MTAAFNKPHLIYITHTTFSLLSQMTFAISLFIASISNNSLFIIAVTGFVTSLSIVVLLPIIGSWVDQMDRLAAVHTALLVKLVSITLGFCICAFLPNSGNGAGADDEAIENTDNLEANFYLYVITLPIVVAAANLGFYTYRICIEKDWVIELANKDKEWLANVNSIMSQIDLAAKSIAPA